MKSINTNTILQIVALLFLVIIGYMSFSSGSNWKFVKNEINTVKKELDSSKNVLTETKSQLQNSKEEFEKMKLQKDLIIHKRDSLIFDFQKKNAKDWDELQRIKDSIKRTNDRLANDQALIRRLLGKE